MDVATEGMPSPFPFAPAQAGAQSRGASVLGPWMPACAGTNGGEAARAGDGAHINGTLAEKDQMKARCVFKCADRQGDGA